jgi:hypothetical protein
MSWGPAILNLWLLASAVCWFGLYASAWRERRKLKDEQLRYRTACTMLSVKTQDDLQCGQATLAAGDSLRINFGSDPRLFLDIETSAATTIKIRANV